jgi:hypothetical protein
LVSPALDLALPPPTATDHAMFVAPLSGPAPEGSPYRDEAALAAAGALGAYRATVGWGRGREPGSRRDTNYIFTERLGS